MLLRVVNKLSRMLGRLPDPVFDLLMRSDRRQLRSSYTWAMVNTAFLASSLKLDRISALEFGVAGGNGLVALERAAARLADIFEIGIDVYGFDSGEGLPRPTDYRDLPNLWPEGGFPMDEKKLRGRLRGADLIVGLVEDTVARFLDSEPAPVGFVAFDLDHYTSTVHAMQLLEANVTRLMPRIHCYFDDILGYTCGHHNGERLAITEFNEAHPHRQVSQIYGVRFGLHRRYREANWTEKMFMTHIVEHPLYNEWDGLLRRARMNLKAA
ncbi:MAG: class I SAM-dependent methyltransferase [Planctomycetota bacterium]|jgi:hypothetical protein